MFKIIKRKLVGKSAKNGYTMTELLTVIAIVAVVVAIAIPSVVAIQRRLTYRQNNEYAKEVFLAAQANLTDMRSKGTLTQLQGVDEKVVDESICSLLASSGNGEYRYTGSTMDEQYAFDLVLPPTSIDSKVRNADIVIDYNPITGNVYSVFYFHKTGKVNLIEKYEDGQFQREDRTALSKKLKDDLIGYWDGSPLVSSKLTREKNNDAMLEFINGEEGIVSITIPINAKYLTNPDEFVKGLDIDLTIKGQNIADEDNYGKDSGRAGEIKVKAKAAGVMPDERKESRCFWERDKDGENNIIIYYVLDSLYDNKSFANLVYGNTSEYLYEAEACRAKASVVNLSEYPDNDFKTCLTAIHNEDKFRIIPGDNVSISASIKFEASGSKSAIKPISSNIVEDVNPMFGELKDTKKQYVLRLDNGRNMQNLNAVAPTVADIVTDVDFSTVNGEDINWNNTVEYYNDRYAKAGSTYRNTYDKADGGNNQAPARALPYFVPINNAHLFGTASFVYPNDASLGANALKGLAMLISRGVDIADSALGRLLDIKRDSSPEEVFNAVDQIFDLDKDTPTLNDELEYNTSDYATVNGNNNAVYYININTNAYRTCKQDKDSNGYYAGCTAGMAQNYSEGEYKSNYKDDSFAGLFGYVNTTIRDLDIVNPKIKGAKFEEADTYKYVQEISGQTLIFRWKWGADATVSKARNRGNNPCAGALAGCCGWNAYLENCGAYIDTKDKSFAWSNMKQTEYKDDANAQTFYGVSGSGAVGGLVGYCKSHSIFSGDVSEFEGENKLAYKECFASLPVTGLMRGADKDSINNDRYYGYTNGVGGLVGNAQLTNFYNCYSGSTVLADGVYIDSQMWDNGVLNDLLRSWSDNLNDNLALLGDNVLDLSYNGRTSMGAGGLIGTSHGSIYRNCFTASSVDATNSLSTSTDKKKSGCAGFVGVMCYQESYAYGNDKTDESEVTASGDISQKSMFLNCYSAGLSRIRDSKDARYESVAENFNGANARTKTATLSELGDYWNGNFYDVYAPAWFAGDTTKSGNTVPVNYEYLYYGKSAGDTDASSNKSDSDTKTVRYTRHADVENLSKENYVFKDSYYLSGYNNSVGSDTYSRCGLPILYERLEDLTATHNNDAWINSQLNVVKNRTVSTLYNNAIQTNDVYSAEKKSDKNDDIKNVNPTIWNFNGIYFGNWINERITWKAFDLARFGNENNTTYRFEAAAIAGEGGLIARTIINEFASPDKRLDEVYVNRGDKSHIGGGYTVYYSDRMGERLIGIDDYAFYNYHKHFENRLGDLEYIYKALYKMGYPEAEWTKATASSTHSYEQSAQNAVYPFSVMTSMKGSGIANDYYGTWVTKPLACGLAYYEKYADGTYGYYYDSLGTSTLRNDIAVVSDGYAILTANSADSVRITETTLAKVYGEEEISYNVNDSDGGVSGKDDEVTFEYITGTQTYAVHLLPWEAIEACSNNAKNYYSKLTVRVKVEAKDESGKDIDITQLGINAEDIVDGYVTFTMYFNPNAAISQINPAVGGTKMNLNAEDPVTTFGNNGPKDGTIIIRTARQFAAIKNLNNYWYDGIKYEQQLNINAADYDGTSYGDAGKGKAVAAANAIAPIGSSSNPFNASYNGYGGYTDKAELGGWDKGISYFGYIGGAGEVKNLVLNCETSYSGSDYIGVLAAENHGNINNAEARIDPSIESIMLNAKSGAGVIAGYNCGGVIENCDVNIPMQTSEDETVVNRVDISSTASDVGGIVGRNNEGSVSGGTVTLGSISGGSNVGGIVGSVIGAKNNSIKDVTVDVSSITGDSVGGIAGSVSKAEISNIDLGLNEGLNGSSYAGGAIGVNNGESTVSNVKLTIKDGASVKSSVAGGFIGDGAYVTVKNLSRLEMNGSIEGADFAGGFAGKLTNSEINGFTLNLNGNVSSASGDAAGFAAIVKGSSVTSSDVFNYGKTISGASRAAGFTTYLDGNDNECFITASSVTGPMTVSSNGDAAGFIVTAEASNNRRVNIETSNVLPVRANADKLAEEYLKLRDTGYEQIKVKGAKNSSGFIVSAKGVSIDSCDTVCSVLGGSDGRAGFAVNVDNDTSVMRCIANTKVLCTVKTEEDKTIHEGAAFILNNEGSVANSYAWFGAEGGFDNESNGYTSCYIASRVMPEGKRPSEVTLQFFDNKGKSEMKLLAELTTEDLNGGNKGDWSDPDSFEKYPFKEINPPMYMYPMLREHYGDWLNPPQFAYGVAYYETLANGKTVIHMHDMADPEINCGLESLYTTGSFTCDNINSDVNEIAADAGYMVFYKDASAIKTVNGGTISEKCEEINKNREFFESIDFTGIKFAGAALTEEQIAEFKEAYTFAFIKDTKNFVQKVSDGQTAPTEIIVTGINAKNQSYTIVPAFADDVRDSGTNHGNDYRIRTGTQFANIATCNDKSFKQQRNIELNGTNIGSSDRDNKEAGSFKGTYTAKRGSGDECFVINLKSVDDGIFRNVDGKASISYVELNGRNGENATVVNRRVGGGNFFGILAHTSSGTIDHVSVHDFTVNFGHTDNSESATKFAAMVGQIGGGTVSNCTVNNVRFNSEDDGGKNGSIYVGAVAGTSSCKLENISVTNCSISYESNKTNKSFYFGGVTGQFDGTSISGITVNGNAIKLKSDATNAYVGGAIGETAKAVTVNSITNTNTFADEDTGVVSAINVETSGETYVGGVVGKSTAAVTANGAVTNGNFVVNNTNGKDKVVYVGGVSGNSGGITLNNASVTNNGAFTIDSNGVIYAGGASGNTSGGISVATSGHNITNSGAFTLNTGADVYVGGAAGQSSGKVGPKTVNSSNITVGSQEAKCAVAYVGGSVGKLTANEATGSVNNANITVYASGNAYVGGVAGHAASTVSIDNNSSTNLAVSTGGEAYVGGVAGQAAGVSAAVGSDKEYKNVTINVRQTGGEDKNAYVGGAVGKSGSGSIDVTVSSPTITLMGAKGETNVGGVSGYAASGEKITATVNDPVIRVVSGEMTSRVGGVIGCAAGNNEITADVNVAETLEGMNICAEGTPRQIKHKDENNKDVIDENNTLLVGGVVGFAEDGLKLLGSASDPIEVKNLKLKTVTGVPASAETNDKAGGGITHAGSIVGWMNGTNAANSKLDYINVSNAKITAHNGGEYVAVGGIAGKLNKATVGETGNNSTVKVSGIDFDLKLGGNADVIAGGLVGHSDGGTVTGSVTNPSFTGDGKNSVEKQASSFCLGGAVGYNQGSIQNCSVSTNEGKNVDMNVSGDYGDLIAGGITSLNDGGTLTGNTFSGKLNYNSSIASTVAEKVEIGGLVGRMQGGSLTGKGTTSVADGSIELASNKKTNGSYVIGGAVGQDTGSATYSNTKVNVAVDYKWHTNTDKNAHYTPANLGAVGKFAGYVTNGQFSNCSGNGITSNRGNSKDYQFLGEIKPNDPISLGSDKVYYYAWDSSSNKNVDATDLSVKITGYYDSFDKVKAEFEGKELSNTSVVFKPLTDKNYYTYSAKLKDCFYYDGKDNKNYEQYIGNDGWYYTMNGSTSTLGFKLNPNPVTSLTEDAFYMIANADNKAIASTDNHDILYVGSIRDFRKMAVKDITDYVNNQKTFELTDAGITTYIWQYSSSNGFKDLEYGYYLRYYKEGFRLGIQSGDGSKPTLAFSGNSMTAYGHRQDIDIRDWTTYYRSYTDSMVINNSEVSASSVKAEQRKSYPSYPNPSYNLKVYSIVDNSGTTINFAKESISCEIIAHK